MWMIAANPRSRELLAHFAMLSPSQKSWCRQWMVLLLDLSCRVPLICGFVFDLGLEKLVHCQLLQAIQGAPRGKFPCIELGVCRPHISRALRESRKWRSQPVCEQWECSITSWTFRAPAVTQCSSKPSMRSSEDYALVSFEQHSDLVAIYHIFVNKK